MKGLFGGLLILIGMFLKADGQQQLIKTSSRAQYATMLATCAPIVATMTPIELRMCGTGCQYGQMNSLIMQLKCICLQAMFPIAVAEIC